MKRLFILMSVVAAVGLVGCNPFSNHSEPPVSSSGVRKVEARVQVQSSGLTIEQENIKNRIEQENMPGAIKHLYVISAYSGQVIVYSTVKGKPTSSGKRLTPYTVVATDGTNVGRSSYGVPITIGGRKHYTGEVLQDDGTYGSSIPYLYWWDSRGIYHQHYVTGGQMVHVSDQPMAVKSIIINMELTTKEGE